VIPEEESKEVKAAATTTDEISQVSHEPVFGIRESRTAIEQEEFSTIIPEGPVVFNKRTVGKLYCKVAKAHVIHYSGVATLKDKTLQTFFLCSAARIKAFSGIEVELGGRTGQLQKEHSDKLMIVDGKSV